MEADIDIVDYAQGVLRLASPPPFARTLASWVIRHSAIVEAAKAQEAAQAALKQAVVDNYHAGDDWNPPEQSRYDDACAATERAVRAAARTMEGK